MRCSIAELIVEVPEAGGMAPRCGEYFCAGEPDADIVLRSDLYRDAVYPGADHEAVAYLESGWQFYVGLLNYGGMMLHASAVELDGRAYLFSGHCGAGKSTHTKLWQQTFGDAAQVFNDDKPALRRVDGKWFAYGTPWCGKDGINQNKKVPLAGICFLKKEKENRIRRLQPQEAISMILSQTMNRLRYVVDMDLLLNHVDALVKEIPIYELENRPQTQAARLSYETMRLGAEEYGL